MTYIISGYAGAGGLGDDAKHDATLRAKLTAQARAGVPGATDALVAANQIQPAQAAWDKAAAVMRTAAAPGIAKLPALAQPSAKKALEDQIVSTLGPRPKTPNIPVSQQLPTNPQMSAQSAGVDDKSDDKKPDNTMLYVGAAAVVGAALLFMRR